VFVNHRFGKILIDHSQKVRQKHYTSLTKRINKGDEAAIDEALAYYTDLQDGESHTGYKEHKRDKMGEELDVKIAELQQMKEALFKKELAAAVDTSKVGKDLEKNLGPILTTTTLGTKGRGEIANFLKTEFASIFGGLTKEKKMHLYLFLKKHNFHGELKLA
jgi:mannitol-1-phosphate/altronate dehydrogenase